MSETGTKTPRGLTAVLFTCIAAATVGVLMTPPPAGAQITERPATVACAATEDSYLTDCHGHRLQYDNGRWYAPAQVTASPAAQSGTARQLPSWFRAYRDAGRPRCAVVGPAFHPNQRGEVCANGTAHKLTRRQIIARQLARISTARMPAWFIWWGGGDDDRDPAVIAGGGDADSTVIVFEDGVQES